MALIILNLVYLILAAFIGYLIGRWGDNYLNIWMKDPNWLPHHWIYGLMMVIIGVFFFKGNLEVWISFFGAGLFVSDLKDFWDFKFFAPDGKTKKTRKFWHID